MAEDSARRTLVLYDGDCNVCRAFARWGARRDRDGSLDFIPYQDAPSPPMTPELRRGCERAVHVIPPGEQITRAGRAILVVLAALGWPVAWLRYPPMIWAVEAGYWAVARSRPLIGRFLKD